MAKKNSKNNSVDITPNAKKKTSRVSSSAIRWIIGFVIIAALGVVAVWLLLRDPVGVDDLANEFCECTKQSEIQLSSMVHSNDNFKYREGLNAFGEKFTKAIDGLGLDDKEKKNYLEKFKAEVLKKCPDNLKDMFEAIPIDRGLNYR